MSNSSSVVLFSGEISPGTSSHTDASIAEAGDLVIATQDLGAAPERVSGDRGYEWWIVVRAANKHLLLTHLLRPPARAVSMGATPKASTA
jgi:hypothetical protein